MHFILASASPARRQTLINAGITPKVTVSEVDEDAIVEDLGTTATPTDTVVTLASAKCRAVADIYSTPSIDPLPGEDILIVGCDSMLHINGRMVGKPHDAATAINRIREMRGGSAQLWTGHHMMRRSTTTDGSYSWSEVTAAAATTVHFGDMSDAEIEAYVATGEPLHVAGSFTVDSFGGPFITGIEGDYHNVVGISLPLLRTMAKELGVFWPDLWN